VLLRLTECQAIKLSGLSFRGSHRNLFVVNCLARGCACSKCNPEGCHPTLIVEVQAHDRLYLAGLSTLQVFSLAKESPCQQTPSLPRLLQRFCAPDQLSDGTTVHNTFNFFNLGLSSCGDHLYVASHAEPPSPGSPSLTPPDESEDDSESEERADSIYEIACRLGHASSASGSSAS